MKSQKSRTGSTPNLSGSTTKLNEKPRGTSHGQVGASPVVRGGSKSQRSHKHHKGEMVKDHVARYNTFFSSEATLEFELSARKPCFWEI